MQAERHKEEIFELIHTHTQYTQVSDWVPLKIREHVKCMVLYVGSSNYGILNYGHQ